jgi:hypothetical protein
MAYGWFRPLHRTVQHFDGKHAVLSYSGRGHHDERTEIATGTLGAQAATLLEGHEPLTAWTTFAGVVPAHGRQSLKLLSYNKRHARPTDQSDGHVPGILSRQGVQTPYGTYGLAP